MGQRDGRRIPSAVEVFVEDDVGLARRRDSAPLGGLHLVVQRAAVDVVTLVRVVEVDGEEAVAVVRFGVELHDAVKGAGHHVSGGETDANGEERTSDGDGAGARRHPRCDAGSVPGEMRSEQRHREEAELVIRSHVLRIEEQIFAGAIVSDLTWLDRCIPTSAFELYSWR